MRFPRFLACIFIPLGLLALPVRAEDVQLRAQAIQLMNHAHVVSTPHTTRQNVQTIASFRAVSADGPALGKLTRLRGASGYLKQDIALGDFHAGMVGVKMQRATTGPWEKPPYAVTRLLDLVPFSVGEFDAKDVIRRIEPASISGAPATCVFFETIEGDKRDPGDICFDNAAGVMLQAHTGDRTFRYSSYTDFAGGRMPGHIDYEEAGGLSLSIDITMSILDTVPADAFDFPAGAKVGNLCARYSQPLPLVVPQPAPGTGSAITTVVLHAVVTSAGTVADPRITHSPRPELNDEALQTVRSWQFQPGSCNGKPFDYPQSLEVQFQGR
jgi:TonB family protein